MPIKTKILKILPFYLSGLFFLIAVQISANLIVTRTPVLAVQGPVIEDALKPQVLGASTSVRGEPQSQPQAQVPLTQIQLPDTSRVSSKSFIVFDLENGQTLFGQSTTTKLKIASLTKLMTGLVAYENSDLNKSFTISQKDILNVKPNLGFEVGDEVKALDVFNAMLIGSCNDAAVALADYVSQATSNNFVDLMNEQAKALGMDNSHFSNPMGFDSQYNYSTAEDLKKLILATGQLSAFADLGRRSSYEFSGAGDKVYTATTTNTLLKNHPDISAIKTGYTAGAAGAMATKIIKNGHEVVILVLDSQNREGDTLKLKTIAEDSFR